MGETSIPDEASGPYARALNFPHGDAKADDSERYGGALDPSMDKHGVPDGAAKADVQIGLYGEALKSHHGPFNGNESGRDAGNDSLLSAIATKLLDHFVNAAEKGGKRAALEAVGEAEAILREMRKETTPLPVGSIPTDTVDSKLPASDFVSLSTVPSHSQGKPGFTFGKRIF